jgi:hypothetical protein
MDGGKKLVNDVQQPILEKIIFNPEKPSDSIP